MSYSYDNFRPKTAEDLAKFFKKRNEIESLFEEGVIHRYGKLEVLGSGQIGRADPILQAPFESFTCRVCVSNDADGETTIDYNDPRAALDVYVLYDSGFLRMVKDSWSCRENTKVGSGEAWIHFFSHDFQKINGGWKC